MCAGEGLVDREPSRPLRHGIVRVLLLRASCASSPSGQPRAVQDRCRRFCPALFYPERASRNV